MSGAQLVELCDVWGRVVGTVQKMCAICFQFRRLKYLQALLYISPRTRGTSRLVNEATSQVRDFSKLRVKKSRTFPSDKHYKQRLDRRGFPVTISQLNVNKMCVCVSRYSATDMWFSLY